jgi:signal transduction histidine kinase
LVYGLLCLIAAVAMVAMGVLVLRRIRGEEIAWQHAIVREIDDRTSVELELQQAQKMEVVGQLASGMAHDYGNLLAGIAMHLSALYQREGEPRQHELTIRAALAGVDKGTKLVRSLLDLARREPLKLDTLDVNERLREIEGLLRQCVEPTSELVLDLAPDAWTTCVDAQALELALLNLAINARDAMSLGGTLRISTRNVSAQRESTGDIGDYVMLEVSDTGTGMEPSILARAAEPFFTTKPAGKGTGLGLSQVAHFAKQSSGRIAIASEAGKGTTVSIYLPRSGKPKFMERAAERASSPMPVWRVRADAAGALRRPSQMAKPRSITVPGLSVDESSARAPSRDTAAPVSTRVLL